jgi:hypothetical protein
VARELLIVVIRPLGRKHDPLNFAPDELLEHPLPSLAGACDEEQCQTVLRLTRCDFCCTFHAADDLISADRWLRRRVG